jgi:hypothetical protein
VIVIASVAYLLGLALLAADGRSATATVFLSFAVGSAAVVSARRRGCAGVARRSSSGSP